MSNLIKFDRKYLIINHWDILFTPPAISSSVLQKHRHCEHLPWIGSFKKLLFYFEIGSESVEKIAFEKPLRSLHQRRRLLITHLLQLLLIANIKDILNRVNESLQLTKSADLLRGLGILSIGCQDCLITTLDRKSLPIINRFNKEITLSTRSTFPIKLKVNLRGVLDIGEVEGWVELIKNISNLEIVGGVHLIQTHLIKRRLRRLHTFLERY